MINLPKTISDIHKGLKNGDFSCVDLVDIYLANINNSNLNAVITITDEIAYKKAKELDEIVKNNPNWENDFPLLGVVFGLKDMFLVKDIKTTAGAKLLENFIAPYTATVWNKLEKAGAILVSKTNQDAWAHGSSGENSDFGVTLNPYNSEYVPGGSSSGSAVSVASDLSFAALGTDTGGSIRLPASFTNVVGFKPTYGVVSRYGVIAMASSLDSIGHFTKTVEDSEKIFEITRGVDKYDATLSEFISKPIPKKLKIGIPAEYFDENLDQNIKKRIDEVINEYKKMGVEFVNVSLPMTKYGVSIYYVIQPAEVSSNLARFDGVRYGYSREAFGAEAKRRIMLGSYVLSSGYYDAFYKKAQEARKKVIEDFEAVFNKVDAIISPVSPTMPFKIGEKSNDPLAMYLSDVYTVSANIAGLPGISIPAGFGENNLPIGFQLIGPRFSENILFELGKMFEKNKK